MASTKPMFLCFSFLMEGLIPAARQLNKDTCDKDAVVNHAVVLIGYGTSESDKKDSQLLHRVKHRKICSLMCRAKSPP